MSEQSNSGLGGKFDNFEHRPSAGLFDKIQMKGAHSSGEFSSLFEGYAHIPNTAVWKRIEAAMHPEKKRRIIFWWSTAAGLALLISTSIWNLSQQQINPVSEATTVEIKVTNPKTEIHKKTSGFGKKLGNSALFNENNAVLKNLNPSGQNENSLIQHNGSFEIEIDLATNQKKEIDDKSNDRNHDLKERSYLLVDNSLKEFRFDKIDPLLPELFQRDRIDSLNDLAENPPSIPKSTKWNPGGSELAANLSPTFNGPAFKNEQYNSPSALAITSSGTPNMWNADMAMLESSGRGVTSIYGGNEEDMVPLSVGSDFRYHLTNRTSVGAGLEFTLLRSRANLYDQGGEIQANISRGYIGIPLSAQYAFIQKNKFSSYIKGSFLPEMGLYQSVSYETSNSYAGDQPGGDGTKGIFKMQYGSSLAIGASVVLSQNWLLYGEASSRSYFYQSHYNTYTNQSIWPSLKVGLALSL